MLFSYFGFSPSRSSFSSPPASPFFVFGENGGILRGRRCWVLGACACRAWGWHRRGDAGRARAGRWRWREVGSWARAALVVARWLREGGFFGLGCVGVLGCVGSGSGVIKPAGLALLTAL